MEPRFVSKPGFRVVGRALTVRSDEASSAIPAFWDLCLREGIFEVFGELCGGRPAATYGLCDDADEETGAWDYVIGVEASEAEAPDGWVGRTIPARRYAVFAVDGALPAAIQETWQAIFAGWLPGSGYVDDQGPCFELYEQPSQDTESYTCEIWIPIRPA